MVDLRLLSIGDLTSDIPHPLSLTYGLNELQLNCHGNWAYKTYLNIHGSGSVEVTLEKSSSGLVGVTIG